MTVRGRWCIVTAAYVLYRHGSRFLTSKLCDCFMDVTCLLFQRSAEFDVDRPVTTTGR